MMDMIKRMKADMFVSAALCIVLGVVLLIWPAQTIDLFCRILASGLIVIGIVNLVSYFVNRELHPFGAVLGTIVTLIGIWIFVRPESVVSLVPIVIGVLLCIHAIQDMRLAFETKQNGYERWWSMLVIALISLIFGLLCISNAFGIVTLALQFIGIALIYDGLTDIWIASRAIRAVRDKERQEEMLEAEYREVDTKKDDWS